MTKFKLVDCPMGAGKTNTTIDYLNTNYPDNDNKRYIICVMYKTEQTRYEDNIPNAQKPNKKEPHIKIEVIKDLVKQGKNIITTHYTFDNFDNELMDLLVYGEYEYDLFIDEQPSLTKLIISDSTEQHNPISNEDTDGVKLAKQLKQIDIAHLIQSKIIVQTGEQQKYKRFVWNNNADNPYNMSIDGILVKGVFSPLKDCLKTIDMYGYGTNKYFSDMPEMLITLKSMKVFECFNNVCILSYLLKGSIVENYLQFYGKEQGIDKDYEFYHLENNQFVQGYKFEYPSNMNRFVLADKRYVVDTNLSKNKCNDKNIGLRLRQKIVKNFFDFKHNIIGGAKADNYIFTTYKELCPDKKIPTKNFNLTQKKKYILNDFMYINTKGQEKKFTPSNEISRKGFIPCNTKATNQFINSYIVGYLVDRFFNPIYKNLFNGIGIRFDEKLFSLSEMVQLIWRSNIRDTTSNKPVYVYIAGKYSYDLFTDFINRKIPFDDKSI